ARVHARVSGGLLVGLPQAGPSGEGRGRALGLPRGRLGGVRPPLEGGRAQPADRGALGPLPARAPAPPGLGRLARAGPSAMSRLEWIAAALGLVNVGLTVAENAWCWPVGAVMVALYGVVFWEQKLYAQAALQVVFFALQFYGLHHWLRGGS